MSYKLLDLYCGAGGCSEGYRQAGFEVVGVDIEPQPNYPFTFFQSDAMEFPLDGYDVIHASPPCKAFTKTGWSYHFGYHSKHKDLLTPTRNRLIKSGIPFVIENVPGAPIRANIMLCGSMFGLGVRRHRYFETFPVIFFLMQPCIHKKVMASPYGHPRLKGEGSTWGPAMGINWMSVAELAQAIPPAYTKRIGDELIAVLNKESGATAHNSKSIQCGKAV